MVGSSGFTRLGPEQVIWSQIGPEGSMQHGRDEVRCLQRPEVRPSLELGGHMSMPHHNRPGHWMRYVGQILVLWKVCDGRIKWTHQAEPQHKTYS